MLFSATELREIAGRASTIDERRAGDFIVGPPPDEVEREQVKARLIAWRHAAAAGDRLQFARRLAAEGLNEETAADLLGTARLAPGQPLPGWAQAFAWAAEAMGAPDGLAADSQAEPLAFEELLRPVTRTAFGRLARHCEGKLRRHFCADARASLQESLIRRLAAVLARALFSDFLVFRHLSNPSGLPFWPRGSRVVYAAYLAAWAQGRGRDFFQANPVAARLIGTALDHWLDATAELVERLDRDEARLAGAFFGDAPLGPVATLDGDLSDPHNGGRTVAVLGFSGDRKLVYKPKDMRIDAAWAALLGWLGAKDAPVSLRAPEVVLGEGYGWAEFIAADKPGRVGDPVLFHRRAGGMLALLHAFRGVDFHHENVIAADDSPVPIDLETLLHPEWVDPATDGSADPAWTRAAALATGSVLGTLYLPLWVRHPGGVGAIGGLDAPRLRQWRSAFREINTDAMAFAPGEDLAAEDPPGRAALAAHIEDFIRGFDDLYGFLEHHRDALGSADGPFARFRGLPVRVLICSTQGYVMLQQRAAAPANLGDGADWSLQFDFRCRMNLTLDAPEPSWRLIAAERRAMARLDVPLFTANTDEDGLQSCDGERIEGCLRGSPFDQVADRIASLGDADRRLQERLARGAIGPAGARTRPLGHTAPPPIAAPDALTAAVRIGEMIKANAIRTDGRANWIGVVPVDHDHSVVSPVGLDLYSGTTGIALFLAALWRSSGVVDYRDLALEALRAVRDLPAARDGGAQMARLLGIGGGLGIGSIVQGLTRAADLLGEPALIANATQIARLIDAERIAEDSNHDVLDGAAGAILGLLALHRAQGGGAALATATACGEHLLRSDFVDGPQAGRSQKATPEERTGFSHGSAGVALSLLRLGRAGGDARFARGAGAVLDRERRFVCTDDAGGAEPETSQTEGRGVCAWCRGSAGVGLARLGCRDLSDDTDFAGEIEAALAATRDAPMALVDHLCCGELGRNDFLLTAGLRLDRPDLVQLARDRAAAVLARAEERGGFVWRHGDDSLNPGLFQGVAGIGYQLLRLRDPAALPSVLLWD